MERAFKAQKSPPDPKLQTSEKQSCYMAGESSPEYTMLSDGKPVIQGNEALANGTEVQELKEVYA